MNRREFAAALATLSAVGALPSARANGWPDKPVRMILSQPPGSGPDNVARVLGDRLARDWGQAVVIDNKPGGQNTIGAQAAARAPADGYNLYFATAAALVTNKYLFKSLPYDPVKDYVPVAFVGRSAFAVVVAGDSPIRTLADLLAQAKAAPGKFTLANEGPRTFGGIIARLFNARAGIDTNLVSYPSVGVALQNLMGGHVQAVIADMASSAQLVRQGKLRFIAVTSPQRKAGWESVPALAETLPDFDMVGWFAVVAPRGTPGEVVDRISRDIGKALADPAVAERIQTIGPDTQGAGGRPEQLAVWLGNEHMRWTRIAKDIDLLPE